MKVIAGGVLACLACALPSVSSMQVGDPPMTRASILDAMFQERISYVDAQETIDPCSLERVLGDTSQFPRFTNWIRAKFMVRMPFPCGVPSGNRWPDRMLRVDSIVRKSEKEREVFLNVYLGENYHVERVTMVLNPALRWVATEIRAENFNRIYRNMIIPP